MAFWSAPSGRLALRWRRLRRRQRRVELSKAQLNSPLAMEEMKYDLPIVISY